MAIVKNNLLCNQIHQVADFTNSRIMFRAKLSKNKQAITVRLVFITLRT